MGAAAGWGTGTTEGRSGFGAGEGLGGTSRATAADAEPSAARGAGSGRSASGCAASSGARVRPQAVQNLAGRGTTVPHEAHTAFGGALGRQGSAALAAELISLAVVGPTGGADEAWRGRVLDDFCTRLHVGLVPEEKTGGADGDEVAVSQAPLADPVAVDQGAVGGIAVAEEVLAAPELDDGMATGDHGVGKHDVVPRVAADREQRFRGSAISRREDEVGLTMSFAMEGTYPP